MGEPPGCRVEAYGRPPEEERRAEEQGVLQVMDERVLEGEIEQRREVGRPT